MSITDSPDYLNQAPFGPAQLAGSSVSPLPAGNNLVFGPFQVGAAGAILIGLSQTAGQAISVNVFWSQGSLISFTQTVPITFVRTTNVPIWVLFPAVGPWCQVTVTNNGGVSTNINAVVMAVADYHTPAEYLGPQIMLNAQSVAIVANSTTNVSPTIHLPGRATLWAQLAGAGVVSLQFWTGTAWVTANQMSMTAHINQSIDVEIPTADWRIQLQDTSGVANTGFAVVTAGT